MQQTCLKCGHVRTTAGEMPAMACPLCGAIYAKVAEAAAAKRTDTPKQAAAAPPKVPAAALRYLASAALVFGTIGAYILHERGERKAATQAKQAAQRPAPSWEQIDESRAAGRAMEAQQRAREAAARAREEAARVAALTPWERRQETLSEQFSPWDGSHRAAEQAIQAQMHNPRSYEHVGTTYVDHGDGRGITVNTRFRGSNAFGAVVTQRAVVAVDAAGRVTSVRFVQ